MSKPFTVVCIPDETTDMVEQTYVAHVMADDISKAMAAGQIAAAESGLGPREPIDWCVPFMCEGHMRNVNDDPDDV